MARRAFTLLEILVVISIIAIVSTFAIPAFASLIVGPTLNQASQTLVNQIGLARQYATTKNRSVEVRFIRYRDPGTPGEAAGPASGGQYRAIQLLEVLESGAPVSLGKPEFLPQNIILCGDGRSSLLDETGSLPQIPHSALPVDGELPRGIKRDYEYLSFRFLSNGSTTLAASQNWFITVLALRDQKGSTTLPANFFILQIDPVSGAARSFRPGVK
jgi:uncharacterized protein (TIGR02596 family)